jgi:ubiquinone biosynthesis protein UbiJ
MDPLATLLRPLVTLINRQIRATTPAQEICREIAGNVVAIRVSDSSLATYFHIQEDGITMTGRYTSEPEVVISGSLLSLAKLATPSATQAIRDGSVELHGDARVAQSFQQLLRYARPDIEEELSGLLGDAAANSIGNFARRARDWGENARQTMHQNISEYLQEESRAVPSRDEVSAFRDEVNTLRDDVARFEARLNKLVVSQTSTKGN